MRAQAELVKSKFVRYKSLRMGAFEKNDSNPISFECYIPSMTRLSQKVCASF